MNTGALGADNHWLRLRFSGINHARLIGSRVEVFDPQTNRRLGMRGFIPITPIKAAARCRSTSGSVPMIA